MGKVCPPEFLIMNQDAPNILLIHSEPSERDGQKSPPIRFGRWYRIWYSPVRMGQQQW